jgi:CRP/FNR family transcriptional regulator
MDKLWYLKQVDLFKGISEVEVMSFAGRTNERVCLKSEMIYVFDQSLSEIYIVKSGKVVLYHLHKGKKIIIDILGAGSVFGNIHFRSQKSSHYAEATEKTYICSMKKEAFLKIVSKRPDIMINLLEIFSEKMLDYQYQLKAAILDSREKVLEQLKKLNGRNSIWSKFSPGVKISHDYLAALTGLNRETVTRAIHDLRRDGKITITNNGKFVLINK